MFEVQGGVGPELGSRDCGPANHPNPVIVRIRNEEIAGSVDCELLGIREASGYGRPAVPGKPLGATTGGRGEDSSRGVDSEHAVLITLRDEQITGPVDDNSLGIT